jgi:hypothetical protein
MRGARLLVLLAALLAVASAVGGARADSVAPTGLHGFLLRADEPQRTSFSRTPSFAWNPVPGALHYEFQLSLSTTFRDNAVIYADSNALTPVEAPAITLPWITGSPHALYARVRAITPDGATPWSDNFGFDMVPPPPPTPLAGYPGLLRWTPVEGALGYQVWLIDARKMEQTTTNSLDEREYYTFHPTASWTSTIRWRIRALRIDATVGSATRLNGIPAVQYGAWSPIYASANPAATGGPITLVGTVSDVFSNGAPSSPAHELTPGFLWTGNQAITGATAELYRVYVFTDSQCLNNVFTSAVIGSPAYSPRPLGPLALPSVPDALSAARAGYLLDAQSEPQGYMYDGQPISTTESLPQATPTTSVPGAPGEAAAPTDGSSATSSSSSTPAPSSTAPAPGSISISGKIGAPIDLWDTNWPESGYYWTVVAVSAQIPNPLSTTVGTAGAKATDTALPVSGGAGFNAGDTISIGAGATAETATVTAVDGNTLTLAAALKFGHGAGESIKRTGGNLIYQDLELPQDVCAAGRVMRFGKASEPSLTSSGQLFATGLSSDGRLTSAVHTTAFYGQPLVSWTPALGADAYEVQWSKTKYPFTAETAPSGGLGFMTLSTSAVLPVGPGTWYYRVRGFDFSLPAGAQQMSWSDPAQLVVAKPKFKIVAVTTPSKKGAPKKKTPAGVAVSLKTITSAGFSMGVPSGWVKKTLPDSVATFVYADRTTGTNVVEVTGAGRGSRTTAQWESDLKSELASALGVTPAAALVTLPAGPAVRLSFTNTVGGKRITQLQYVVDAGETAYTITFTSIPSRYTVDAATFAKMIASLRLAA